MLVFEESGKAEYPEKNLLEQRREPTTNLTHIWYRVRESNPGHCAIPAPLKVMWGIHILCDLCSMTWKWLVDSFTCQNARFYLHIFYASPIFNKQSPIQAYLCYEAVVGTISQNPFATRKSVKEISIHQSVQFYPHTPLILRRQSMY